MIIGQWLSFGIGGTDKASYYLTKGLIENGIEVKIFYNEWSFPKVSPQMESGVKLLSRYDQCKALGAPMFEIKDVSELNNHGLDILHTHRSGDDFWLIPGLEKLNCNFKIVETNIHGHFLSKADVRVFPSHEMIKHRTLSIAYEVIPNPIAPRLSDEDLRQELGLVGKFVFGKISRPSRDIYSSTCLGAFKLIENNNMHFLYAAPHQLAIDDAINFQIKNITFLDQTLDEVYISKLYNTFDVLCHSNKLGETFGNTIAEAMMHGKPVISHIGGDWPQAQKEVIGVPKHGYICVNDTVNYSKLMLKLFIDRAEYENYAVYAKNRADTLYDYRVVSKRYVDVYRKLLGA